MVVWAGHGGTGVGVSLINVKLIKERLIKLIKVLILS